MAVRKLLILLALLMPMSAFGQAVSGATSGGASAANDLSDVTITSRASGDILVDNGGAYVNEQILAAIGSRLTNGRIPFIEGGIAVASGTGPAAIAIAGTDRFWVDTSGHTRIALGRNLVLSGSDNRVYLRAQSNSLEFYTDATSAVLRATLRSDGVFSIDEARFEQGADIASAATISVATMNAAYVTGTTNIDTINTCDSTMTGKPLTLLFAGSLTVGDLTGNLDLAGNFTTTSGDTLSLACVYDGTNYRWRETSRSAN